MKKTTKKQATQDFKPDSIVAFDIHDDNCPYNSGKPCICTPTRIKMTVAQMGELFAQVGCQVVEETPDQEKKKG